MDLEALRRRLAELDALPTPPPEAEGLRAFIAQAERLPPGSTIMGKIMQSVLSMGQRDAVRNATDIASLRRAFGPEFVVTAERL